MARDLIDRILDLLPDPCHHQMMSDYQIDGITAHAIFDILVRHGISERYRVNVVSAIIHGVGVIAVTTDIDIHLTPFQWVLKSDRSDRCLINVNDALENLHRRLDSTNHSMRRSGVMSTSRQISEIVNSSDAFARVMRAHLEPLIQSMGNDAPEDALNKMLAAIETVRPDIITYYSGLLDEHLSEEVLIDFLAWIQTPSGQAYHRASGFMTSRVTAFLAPLLEAAFEKAFDDE